MRHIRVRSAQNIVVRGLQAPLAGAFMVTLGCGTPTGSPEPVETPAETPEDAETIQRPSDRRTESSDDSGAESSGGDETESPASPGDEGTSGSDDSGSEATEGDSDTLGGADDVPPDAPSPLRTARSSASDSLLYVMVWRDPSAIGNSFAHDHVVRATAWAGSFEFRPGDAASCFVDIDVETAGLLNDEPAMRSEVGLPGTLSESDREEVRDHMLGEGQLEADQFPTISFTSVACRGDLDGSGTLEVDGDLTIRNETRRVTWPVSYEVDSDGNMYASGELTVAQTDFGITPYSAFFGTVKVADDVDLVFDLVGSPVDP